MDRSVYNKNFVAHPIKLGIVGGLGARATASFYSLLCSECSRLSGGALPALMMYSVPITPDIEEGLIQKNVEKRQACLDKVSLIISEGVKTLHASGCNLIILPCNTLQDLFSSIVTQIGVDTISPVDASVAVAQRKGWKNVAVIQSSELSLMGTYSKSLHEMRVSAHVWNFSDQEEISSVLLSFVQGREPRKDLLNNQISKVLSCVDGVILGCTDILMQDVYEGEAEKVISSVEALASCVAQRISRGKNE